MFSHTIPDAIEGFELSGDEEAELMQRLWPTGTTEDGTTVTDEILRRFLRTKTRMAMFHQPPLEPGAEEVDDPVTQSRVGVYTEGRNRVDLDGTSHISAYLAAGLVSPRDCIRAAYEVANSKTLPSSRDTGLGASSFLPSLTVLPLTGSLRRRLLDDGDWCVSLSFAV